MTPTVYHTLAAYSAPLDRSHAAHLLRRTAFGGSPDEVHALIEFSSDDAVDAIVDAALALALPEPPVWANEGLPAREDPARQTYLQDLNPMWLTEYYADLMQQIHIGGLRERMMLFWHNHFVTQIASYRIAPFAYRYVTTLRQYALGNLKTFVHAIGLQPAMLLYLNGIQNRAGEPNENYARELLELFTMGQLNSKGEANYTQTDIEEIARALTGWTVDSRNLTVQLIPNRHDRGDKTIIGRSGPWGYDDVVDILFEERGIEIAEFVCRKLYREFVHATADEELVSDLAQSLVADGFEIAPTLRKLLASAHFHDDHVIGAQIKSPVSMVTGLMRESHAAPEGEQFMFLHRAARQLGQRLLDPPNVAGWEGHHDWINTTTLPTRWNVSELLILGRRANLPSLDLIGMSESLLANAPGGPYSPNDSNTVFLLAVLLAEHLMAVPPETLDLSPPSEGFVGNLTLHPIPEDVLNGPDHARSLPQIMLQGIFPWYEWRLDREEASTILELYVRFLSQLPEFQLA